MNKMKSYRAVARVNFRYTTWIAYLIAAICAVAMIVDFVLDKIIGNIGDTSVAFSSMFYLVCVMAPIFIASVNYTKLMNIGVKKKAYFYGCIINYVVFAAGASLLATVEHFLIDPKIAEYNYRLFGLLDENVFGWGTNVFTAFFSQFAFLMMVQAAIHTLVFMQTKWYGWAADILIVSIISFFTPIAALRSVELFFFRYTIFVKPAILQMAVCLALAAAFYATNLFYLKRRSNA